MSNNDLVQVIIDDHRAVETVFKELEEHTDEPQRRRDLVDHVITELVKHSVAEEQYMYPAAREHIPNGDKLTEHEIQEHAEAERVMKDLERLEVTDPAFDEKLGTLMADIRHHVEDEEDELLPLLQEHCSDEQLQELGAHVLRAKKVAPTRPHPSAPDTPPANMIIDPGAGLVDRIRDRISERSN
ncbi:MAG TPA: hemerythrin domain-containing protein [Candidatus Stackebrandtia faecavium]|nr:hemerythrin domain-containing protein [Candidatus Stackebrandtia faecavium]